jgi:glycosyltransferase involved in cell wall biosynthesis
MRMDEGLMSEPPKVSVGLPVYNGSRFLAESIEAIRAQSYENFELIVSDNCSTDDTAEIAREYAALDPRIRYVRNDRNLGAAANFNRTFELARGEYFKWAADDDLCTPDFLERCVGVLENDPSVILVHPLTELINPDGSVVQYDPERDAYVDSNGKRWRWKESRPEELSVPDPIDRFEHLLLKVVGCTEVFGLIRASFLRRTSLIGPYYGSDKVLLAELALLGRFEHIAEPLFRRRCHPRQSGYKNTREREEWITGLTQNRIVFPQRKVLLGYFNALASSPLGVSQRMRGMMALARYIARPKKIRKLLVPGTSNAFGLEAAAPAGALVASAGLQNEGSTGGIPRRS